MYKYISAIIIALAFLCCSSNPSSSSCSQWEVIVSPFNQLESNTKINEYGDFNKNTTYKIPQGWEPIGSVGIGRWVMLRKCVK